MSKPVKRAAAPLFWLPFGAGGMVSALFGVGLVIVSGFLLPDDPPNYETARAFVGNPLSGLVLFAVITLFFWHGAERLYLTLKDMRAGPKPLLKAASYGVAGLLTLLTLGVLLSLRA